MESSRENKVKLKVQQQFKGFNSLRHYKQNLDLLLFFVSLILKHELQVTI